MGQEQIDKLEKAVEMISARIGFYEKTAEEFFEDSKDKLETLSELAKTVAVLLDRSEYGMAQLKTVSDSIKASAEKTDSMLVETQRKTDDAIHRLHTRMDDLTQEVRNRVESTDRRMQEDMRNFINEHSIALSSLEGKVAGVAGRIGSWTSWGQGAYAVGAVLCTLCLWVGSRWLESLDARTKDLISMRTDVEILRNIATETAVGLKELRKEKHTFKKENNDE